MSVGDLWIVLSVLAWRNGWAPAVNERSFARARNTVGACLKPQGAFYLFPNAIEAAKLTGFDTVDAWVEAILEEEKVALVPGSGFGSPENVRLSYATSLDLLEKAVERIHSFMTRHMK